MALNLVINCSIATFNIFAFRNDVGMLNELCCNNDLMIIAVQEHWLHVDDLDKFNLVHFDYNVHAISSMCSAVSVGILKGRPFDGIPFLMHKSMNGCINFIQAHPNGRCIVFKLNPGQTLFFYFTFICSVMRTVPRVPQLICILCWLY